MRGPGILQMLEIAVGLSMAGPMFIVGFEFIRTGQTIGGVGFFALGVVALFFPSYLVRRIGGPRTWIRRRLGSEDDSANSDVNADTNSSLLDRFRN
ncbi:hypothetical protein [Natronobeatus ordinarius]|uniref:hypothetical protein n=1 Tax=Natronobeatus ordinarius TaxID=2963433 RepID=UPI0020CFA7B6|nr:hypothetical protein [Natronobeatus ordinarius]